jgi:biopolymer transport protein ExbD
MARRRRGRRRRAKIVVPVASMGDIAFLLIIFFMICSNFAKEAGIPVEPPRSPDLDTVKESTIVVSIDGDQQIYFQGRKTHSARSVETEVGELLKDVTKPDSRLVLFRCDRGVAREVFEPVMDAITRGGGIIVAVGEKGGPKRPTEPAASGPPAPPPSPAGAAK